MSDDSERQTNSVGIDYQSKTETREVDVTSTPASLSTDTLFNVLANQRRRYVLHALKEHETPLSLAALATKVAALENERPGTEIPRDEHERVHASLWHSHVPKLDDAGIVEFDRESDTVTLAEDTKTLEPYLERETTV